MPSAESDPLKQRIQEVAKDMDVSIILDAETVEDPMLIMVRDAIIMGGSPEEALTEVVERIAAASEKMLELLDFPPNATHGYQLAKQLDEAGLTRDEMSAAISNLQETGKVGAINGWYFRKPEPRVGVEDLTDDDIDWLTGTGRFA